MSKQPGKESMKKNPDLPVPFSLTHLRPHWLSVDSPLSRVSELSPSSSFSNGFPSSPNGFPVSTPFDDFPIYPKAASDYAHGSTSSSDQYAFQRNYDNDTGYFSPYFGLGLCDSLSRTHISDGGGDNSNPCNSRTQSGRVFGSNYVEGSSSSPSFNTRGFEPVSSVHQVPVNLPVYAAHDPYTYALFQSQRQSQYGSIYQNPNSNTSFINNHQSGLASSGSSRGVDKNNPFHPVNCSHRNAKGISVPNNSFHESTNFMNSSSQNVREAFRWDDSLILEGEHSRGFYVPNTITTKPKTNNAEGSSQNGHHLNSSCDSLFLPILSSISNGPGSMYSMAKDQNGCRLLQQIFEEGTALDVQIIFDEIIDHIVDLMKDPFGNYLVQKLLQVCTQEQRLRIVFAVTGEPGQLVRIALNTFGTRVVQKLVSALTNRREIALVKAALKPGFLALVKDLNGNHVIQRCLHCFTPEDNKFIYDAAIQYCVEVATHCHGCCVLQRCIDHSRGRLRDTLVSVISNNGLLLAQDPYGNYVVQYIIEMKVSSSILLHQFKGNYAQLSTQKFSSNVVEKCLKYFVESRHQIIKELLSVPHFEDLMQDPFANYVIQSAMQVTKGSYRAALADAVDARSYLRTSPYCKNLFAKNLLRK